MFYKLILIIKILIKFFSISYEDAVPFSFNSQIERLAVFQLSSVVCVIDRYYITKVRNNQIKDAIMSFVHITFLLCLEHKSYESPNASFLIPLLMALISPLCHAPRPNLQAQSIYPFPLRSKPVAYTLQQQETNFGDFHGQVSHLTSRFGF